MCVEPSKSNECHQQTTDLKCDGTYEIPKAPEVDIEMRDCHAYGIKASNN